MFTCLLQVHCYAVRFNVLLRLFCEYKKKLLLNMSCSHQQFICVYLKTWICHPPTQTTSSHHQFSLHFQTSPTHNTPPHTHSYKAGCGLSTLIHFTVHLLACCSTIMSLTGSLTGLWILALIMTLPSINVGGNSLCILQGLI